MRFGLSETTIVKLQAIFSHHPQIDRVILYGSRAKGNFKTGSDIDLCLLGTQLNLDLLSKILEEIEELLLPYTVDLSLYSELDNQDLKSHIDRVGQVFYAAH